MLKKVMVAAVMALALVGCGEKVSVPSGAVGKIVTKDGYQEAIIPTSDFRLPVCNAYCDRLIVLDVTDRRYSEPLKIFIPSDKLDINLNVEATLRVDRAKADGLFSQLPQEKTDNSRISVITGNTVYNTYGRQIMEAEVRSYLTQYSIAEISSNIEKINADIREILQRVMGERTPFKVVYAGLTNIEFPPIITRAQEASAERREAIAKENAQLEVSKVTLERELKEAQMNRQIEKEKAETKAIEQRAVAETLTPQYLRMRELEIEEIKARKWNGTVPSTVMGQNAPGMLLNIAPK